MKSDGAVVGAVIAAMEQTRRILKDAGILWQEGRIIEIGESRAVSASAAALGIPVRDALGAAVFPGLINTHNHIFQHLRKGLGPLHGGAAPPRGAFYRREACVLLSIAGTIE